MHWNYNRSGWNVVGTGKESWELDLRSLYVKDSGWSLTLVYESFHKFDAKG